MSTYLAKAVGGQPRGGGPQQHHQQTAGGLQHNGAVKSNPARQTVGFSVASNADRLGFIGNVLIGYKVEAQVSSGMVYEGVFGSLHNDNTGVSFILKYAKVIKDPSASTDRTALAEKPVPILTIPAADLVQLFAKDVRLSAEDLSGADRSDVGFETDAAISRGRGGCVRELQRWQPDEGDDSAFFSLESTNDSTGWDQFAVNRDRFGVQTTWNEHFYTTKINPEECRISEAEAQRIAKEIEQGNTTSTTNIHLLEERGGELSVDVDEEALYGAVIRDAASGPYQHPNHHQQQQRRQQQQQARAPQQSVSDRVAAWGRAGSGVAAVAGGLATPQHHQQQHQTQRGNLSGGGVLAGKATSVPVPVPSAPASAGGAAPTPDTGSGSAGSSTAGATAPIDIDPRKEVNKVRSSLTTWPKKDRSSPYGTPRLGMSRSPVFASPLVGDPVSFSALDLDPGAPQQVQLDPEAQAEFLRFKEEQNKKRLGQMGADLKKAASSSFKERVPLGTGNGTVAVPSVSESAPAAPAAAVPSATADAPASVAAAAAAAAVASLVAGPLPAVVAGPAAAAAVASSNAAPTPAPPAAPAPVATSAATTTAAAPAAAVDGTEGNKTKMASKLNPNAKPFSLNINAKEFVPSFALKFAPPSVTAATAPTTTAASSTAAAPAISSSNTTSVATGAPATVASIVSAPPAATVAAVAASSAAAAAVAVASNVPSAPPAAAAAAAQAATTAISSGQMSYIPGAGAHGLTVTYHHSSSAHSHSHGHGGSQHYGHAGQGSGMHMGHGHATLHHERGGFGGGAGGHINRDLREHGGMYHRSGDSFRSTISDGVGGGGYRVGGAGDPFRTGAGSGSGDGYHHHHHHHHHKAGGGAAAEHHMVKGADPHGSSASGLHKVPPPPPQGPMAAEGPMGPIISVAPATMAPHHVIGAMAPMTAAGMAPMGYSMVLQAGPGGGYVASAMPPGTVAIPATTSGGMPIIGYVARPPAGTPITAVTPSLAMMGAPGMATPYGAHVGPYMTAAHGTMPPPSPTGRPPSTGYFQPAGTYPMIATAAHPGGPHGHPHAAPMGSQPGGPMSGHHLMPGPPGHGHGHGHGPGHIAQHQHLQDSRGPMGPGGPKGGRQGGRPPRMDHDRMARDLD